MRYLTVKTSFSRTLIFDCVKIYSICFEKDGLSMHYGHDNESVFGFSVDKAVMSSEKLEKITTNCPVLYKKLDDLLKEYDVGSVQLVCDDNGHK